MDTAQLTSDVERVIEILGIVVFALSGAMLAIRKDFDIVGIVMLAIVTALGGGIIRDLLIGSTPPSAFARLDYLLLPLGVAAVAAIAHAELSRINRAVLVFDALGLALFTVNGTLIANNAGLGPLQAALLGITTGVGGGLARDVVAREVPLIVRRDSEIYAIPVALGALLVAFVHGQHGVNAAVVAPIAAALIFTVRAAAMVFGWRAPGALRR